MPKVKKDHMWGIVQEKFIFYPVATSTMKSWTLKNILEKWRGYKGDLKRQYFDETSNIVDVVDRVYAERKVDKSQFKKLMIRWRTDEDKEVELKREPARSEIYVKTRVRVDGTFSSRASETIVCVRIRRIGSYEALPTTSINAAESSHIQMKALTCTQT
ncbi:hypothetical protein ACFE04_026299 [Oxalis oulophora]